ncbi:MADS-box transcription factor 32 [Apostasia shenzhenica]|uniref:MADS-box transcription factor 32 n=1 Tax=Apostasia shenzhenica TaxID=1088818 RepID=A0A2I0ANQ8_9ASPA|nr:MADS-box transcription factor 32 [Apostasia shenzhenica]
MWVIMGRGRMEIKKIENPTQRQSTFYKRRDGLFKKARELAVLCDVDLLLLLFSSSGKLYHYHSPTVPNVQELIERYEKAVEKKVLEDGSGDERREMEEVGRLCEALEREMRFMQVDEKEDYSLADLQMVERNLEAAINKVRGEMETKIHKEMEKLHDMVKQRQQEGYSLCEELSHGSQHEEQESEELDLKLGFD